MPAIITGLTKGFVAQVVSLASLVIGVWAAFRFYTPLADVIGKYISTEPAILNIISFTLTVIVAVVLLNLLGRIITKVLEMAALGWANRLLGLAFALFKAALVVSLMIFLFKPMNAQFSLVKPELIDSSVLFKALDGFAMGVFPFLKDLLANV